MPHQDEYRTYILGQLVISEPLTTINYGYKEYMEEIFSKNICKAYIIDLTFSNYLSSSGVGIIIQLKKKYDDTIKVNLVVPSDNAAISVPVQVLKISSLIPVFSTLQDALINVSDTKI